MKENLKDILSNLKPGIDQETLLLYLQGKLSSEQQHEVEKQMMDHDFDDEAMEGLHHFKDKEQIKVFVQQLNKELKKKTEKKKKDRNKLPIQIEGWIVVAIILILVLAVIAYFIIQKQMNGQ